MMRSLRTPLAAFLWIGLSTLPAWAGPKPASSLGTVITADHARIGDSSAEIGTTIFGGDRLATDHEGSMQIRSGAARMVLQSASAAVVNDADGAPSAKLLMGTATFSTGNAKAFTLYVSRATIRAQSNAPTIGQVTYLGEKELLVFSKRGPLTITVDDETQLIPEGTSYRVLLDSPADQGPEGAGSGKDKDKDKEKKKGDGRPLRAGRNHFTIAAAAFTAVVTGLAVSEALESAARP